MSVKGTATDRWKRKDWYEVIAPKIFNEKPVGMILASDPKQLIGRTVRATLYDLTDDVRKSHMNLNLEIVEVDKANKAKTRVKSFELARDYVRSLFRRATTKIDAVVTVKLKDDFVVRIKPFMVTTSKCDSSQKHQIRRTLLEKTYIFARTQTLESLLTEVLSDRLPKILKEQCKVIFPIKNVEVRMIEILTHTDRELQDITTKLAPRRIKRSRELSAVEAAAEAKKAGAKAAGSTTAVVVEAMVEAEAKSPPQIEPEVIPAAEPSATS